MEQDILYVIFSIFICTGIMSFLAIHYYCKKKYDKALEKFELLRKEVDLIESFADRHLLSISEDTRLKLHNIGTLRIQLRELIEVALKKYKKGNSRVLRATTEILETGVDIPDDVLREVSNVVPFNVWALKNWEKEIYNDCESVLYDLKKSSDVYSKVSLSNEINSEQCYSKAKELIAELRRNMKEGV